MPRPSVRQSGTFLLEPDSPLRFVSGDPFICHFRHRPALDVGLLGRLSNVFSAELEIAKSFLSQRHFGDEFLVRQLSDLACLITAVPCLIGISSPFRVAEAGILSFWELNPFAVVFCRNQGL